MDQVEWFPSEKPHEFEVIRKVLVEHHHQKKTNRKTNNMKVLSILAVALLPRTVAELSFNLEGTQRALSGSGGLIGCWGQFSQEGACVEKIPDPDDATSDKVKFEPCDDMEPAQMWKFGPGRDDFDYYGLLYNMAGGCLAIRGDVGEGKNLKVQECDDGNAKQQWYSDGDSLHPNDYRWEFCASAASYPINPRDPVVLLSCDDTWSLDYSG